MHLQENTLFDLLPWGQGHTKHCQVPPLHHVSYTTARFEVAMSNGLGEGDRRTDFWFDIYLRK